MIASLKRFFTRAMDPGSDAQDDEPRGPEGDAAHARDAIRLAACALLLEIAHGDDEFSAAERAHLESAVRRHFGLQAEAADELIRLADEERRRAVDLWQFTRLIREHYSIGQKMVLAEIMWGLVFSDGELSSHEDHIVRRVSRLLDLEIGYLSEARRRAESGLLDEVRGID